ncbi:MAG: hypothetical protein OQJ81_02260, partial [Melioribacteraceae bacterium]|nr:hypothetical protein [Melioribacteraceae bacterium]
NQPVESSLNSEGKLLVPLNRSNLINNQLDTFPVEVIYNLSDNPFTLFGSHSSNLPAVDLMVSQLIWSVYLPNDYSYKYFNSTLEKEEIIRGINIFADSPREYDESMMDNELGSLEGKEDLERLKKIYKGKDYKSSFRNNQLKEEQMRSQVSAEMEFSRRLDDIAKNAPSVSGSSMGVLPIQIEVPTNGQVYRFAKSIIKSEDELSFSVIYVQLWFNKFIQWLFIILIVMLLYLNRRKFVKPLNFIKEQSKKSFKTIEKNKETLRKYSNSYVTSIVLLFLVFALASISYFFSIILLALFITSVINLIINYTMKKKNQKNETIETIVKKDDLKVE